MATYRGRAVPEPRPREVAGYARAQAGGLLPRVPESPPPVLPGRTAGQASRWFMLQTAAAVAVALLLVEVWQRVGLPPAAWSVLVLLTTLGALAVGFVLWGRVGDRLVVELEQGYTTLRLPFGGFWWGELRRWQRFGQRAPWDYRGVWCYDLSGREVRSVPDRSVEPPGFYPSPNRTDRWELWTGVVWCGTYRASRDHAASG